MRDKERERFVGVFPEGTPAARQGPRTWSSGDKGFRFIVGDDPQLAYCYGTAMILMGNQERAMLGQLANYSIIATRVESFLNLRMNNADRRRYQRDCHERLRPASFLFARMLARSEQARSDEVRTLRVPMVSDFCERDLASWRGWEALQGRRFADVPDPSTMLASIWRAGVAPVSFASDLVVGVPEVVAPVRSKRI